MTSSTFRAEAVETARSFGIGLLIFLIVRIFVFQPFTIPSESMEPALRTGDYIFTTKYDYGWSRQSLPLRPPLFEGRLNNHAPRRGDVVVFALPRDPRQAYVKRVIGLPGDRVQVRDGAVRVNGKALSRLDQGLTRDPVSGETVRQYWETSPDGRSYTTFDRGPGHDGDDTGVYLVPAGHYFMMGDNRDNSLDSRWPSEVGVGFVPAENLIGRVRTVLWSWREGASLFKPWTWASLQPGRFFLAVR